MTQAQDDDFDWTRHRLATPSGSTGPTGDNTVNRNGRGKLSKRFNSYTRQLLSVLLIYMNFEFF